MFHFERLHLENFRCFDALDLDLEDDVTVLFAENGGGKTALLSALAMGMSAFQRGSPRDARPDAARDPRLLALGERGRREPAGVCSLAWTASVDGIGKVEWSTVVNPATSRTEKRHGSVLDAIERTRVVGEKWPLFAWYGTDRLARSRPRKTVSRTSADRWDGYASSLDPALNDGPLLKWFTDEILSDAVRRREGEPERFLDAAVGQAMVRATPGVEAVWYEPRERAPTVRFKDGRIALWSELSDGFHVFLALIADIARRAVMLNEVDAGDAPERIEGVVLIDEIDLHLHPRWQRIVLDGLRAAFPRLQLIVTTHSPQVLSSVKNRQARLVTDGKLWDRTVFVEGRDSNAIMREYFRTDARDEEGVKLLEALDDAIDAGRADEARRLFDELHQKWGGLDPVLIRRRSRVERLG